MKRMRVMKVLLQNQEIFMVFMSFMVKKGAHS